MERENERTCGRLCMYLASSSADGNGEGNFFSFFNFFFYFFESLLDTSFLYYLVLFVFFQSLRAHLPPEREKVRAQAECGQLPCERTMK